MGVGEEPGRCDFLSNGAWTRLPTLRCKLDAGHAEPHLFDVPTITSRVGEEPERLRGDICEFCGFAVVDGLCCRAGREHRAAIESGHKGRVDSGQVTAQSETPPEVPERPPLTAEPERLRALELIAQARRDLWWFIETYTEEDTEIVSRAMAIQDDLLYPALAEVERLGKVEQQLADLDARFLETCGEGMRVSADLAEARAEVEQLAGERDEYRQQAINADDKCERLAGRVAAAKEALPDGALVMRCASGVASTDEGHALLGAFQAVRAALDVEGSEAGRSD